MNDMANTLAPSDSMQQFIVGVRATMDQREIGVQQLANMAGMPRPSLSSILNGKAGSCSFKTADNIAKALGTSTLELLALAKESSEISH